MLSREGETSKSYFTQQLLLVSFLPSQTTATKLIVTQFAKHLCVNGLFLPFVLRLNELRNVKTLETRDHIVRSKNNLRAYDGNFSCSMASNNCAIFLFVDFWGEI